MMAKYLNECDYYVPVKRQGEGQYMYGSKKIFAKIMNGKLVIRVGGGYMLIDEFLRNYAEQERDKAGLEDISKDNMSPIKSKYCLIKFGFYSDYLQGVEVEEVLIEEAHLCKRDDRNILT